MVSEVGLPDSAAEQDGRSSKIEPRLGTAAANRQYAERQFKTASLGPERSLLASEDLENVETEVECLRSSKRIA